MFDTKDKGMGLNLLKYFCNASHGQIAEMFNATIDSKSNIFVPSENDSKILFVAHRDVVTDRPRFELLEDKNTVISSMLDDKLGIYAAYILRYKYKLDFDILLTDFEEKCDSSAQYFKTNKQYNWMFQFDRAGQGAVMYDYENVETEKLLNNVGIQLQVGSYSDICELDHLGCVGINFGVAYYKQHSPNCYMKIDEFKNQVRKFKKFYDMYKDVAMPFDSKDPKFNYAANYNNWWKKSSAPSKGISMHDYSDEEEFFASEDAYYAAYFEQESRRIKAMQQGEKVGRKKKGDTKVYDFRAPLDREANKKRDEELNRDFGGVVEKADGSLVNIKWVNGTATFTPVEETEAERLDRIAINNQLQQETFKLLARESVAAINAPKIAPKPFSREWYMSDKSVDEIHEEMMALDSQCHAAIGRDI